MELLLPFMPEKARPDSWERTYAALGRQLGAISHGLQYAENRKVSQDPNPAIINGYYQEARLGHADAIVQLIVMAEQQGWDWETQLFDGLERFKERMQELKEGII